MVTALQLSPTVGEPRLTLEAMHEPGSVFTALFAGQAIVGGVVSTKVMCWVQIDDWAPFVAVQMRLMPARPVQLAGVTTSVKLMVALPPPQFPLAVAVPVLLVAVESPHCNCLSPVHAINGAPGLTTVTVVWHALLR